MKISKKTLHNISLFFVPALLGVAVSLVDLFAHEFLVLHVTVIGALLAGMLWGSIFLSTYLRVVHLDNSKKLHPALVFFVHLFVTIFVFGFFGTAVYWAVVFWPWK